MDNNYMLTLLLVLLFFLTPDSLYAYNDIVHQPITEVSVVTSNIDDLLIHLGYGLGIKTEIHNSQGEIKLIVDWVAEGGVREDDSLDECKPEQTRASNHFHDPTKSWDEAFFDDDVNATYTREYGRPPVSALLWGLNFIDEGDLQKSVQVFDKNTTGDWSWPKARTLFYDSLTSQLSSERENKFADSLRSLGQVAHLIQDMSVPAHTRNDPHVFPLTSSSRPCWPGLFSDLLDALTSIPPFPWHYETYTWDWATKDYEDFENYLITLVPVFPSQDIFAPVIQNYDENYLINGSPKLSPVSGLFDTNTVGDETPLTLLANDIGLSEYSNGNFFSKDTIFAYPHPSKADTTYGKTMRTARDDKVDFVLHYYRVTDTQKEHPVAALKYWAENAADPELEVNYLDDDVFASYASFLIPRAVGYSAALLDYFFRGTLEISPPDQYVYAIIDGGEIDPVDNTQYLHTLKAKVKNNTPDEEMLAGSLVAIAKYKNIIGYQPDLSSGSPSAGMRETEFSYSVSAPIEISSLSSTTPEEFSFDFTNAPIPVGITDLYLNVVFRGTLGNENKQAIAVGVKDLNEPQHIATWNDTDYFQLDGVPVKAEDIRRDDPLIGEIAHIDPHSFTETIGFSRHYPDIDSPPIVVISDLPPARYSRIIVVTDADDTSYFLTDQITAFWPPDEPGVDDPSFDGTWKYSLPTAIHQEGSDGVWQSSPVYRVRDVIQHQSLYFINFHPIFSYISNLPAPPENALGPFPAIIDLSN